MKTQKRKTKKTNFWAGMQFGSIPANVGFPSAR